MSLDRLQIPEVENDYTLTPLTSIPEVYFRKRFLERQKLLRRSKDRREAFWLAAAWLATIAILAGIRWRFFS